MNIMDTKSITAEEIKELFESSSVENRADWCLDVDAKEDEIVLKEQSKEFQRFWREKILNNDYPKLSESDMNRVILFFDNTAKGSKEFKESGGVSCAKANLRMTQWYTTLRSLKEKKDIQSIVNQVFTEEDDAVIIDLLNELEKINKGSGNGLTSAGTIALSAILFTFNPDRYLTMLHLAHRLALIDFFGFGDRQNYRTLGEKIINAKNDIISGFKEKFGINTTPFQLSFFIYCHLDGKYGWKSMGKSKASRTDRENDHSEVSELSVAIQRNKMSESVRNAVWRRDRGQCTECGSREKLEYDHIVPVSKGGSNTARNIELLCESCNRKKSNKI